VCVYICVCMDVYVCLIGIMREYGEIMGVYVLCVCVPVCACVYVCMCVCVCV